MQKGLQGLSTEGDSRVLCEDASCGGSVQVLYSTSVSRSPSRHLVGPAHPLRLMEFPVAQHGLRSEHWRPVLMTGERCTGTAGWIGKERTVLGCWCSHVVALGDLGRHGGYKRSFYVEFNKNAKIGCGGMLGDKVVFGLTAAFGVIGLWSRWKAGAGCVLQELQQMILEDAMAPLGEQATRDC
jgi:hypothetical protein